MKGDFSRDTFDVAKHFSRVLQQQGRVQLDADWNEQTAILLHYLRTLAADLIGPFAGPAGEAMGFKIEPPEKKDNAWDFGIGKGRYYVDGILCENNGSDKVTYLKQKDFPNPLALSSLTVNKKYLVYLDVWERHITALEEDVIREKALGGPDTATRAQVVWQVRIWPNEAALASDLSRFDILQNWKKWTETFQPSPRGCLRARVKPQKDSQDPCLTAPDSKYRGPENQLYRVEIHNKGGVGTATFKWSRDNGSIVTACELNGTELTVHSPRGFSVGQWVELIADEQELKSEPGTMVKVIKVEDDVLSLESEALKKSSLKIQPTKVRCWDHHETKEIHLKDGSIILSEQPFQDKDAKDALWINLEDGIQIQFLKPSNNATTQYRTGDYWLFPARVTMGDIEWPDVNENGKLFPAHKPPNGIRHHYAPLAILTNNESGWTMSNGDLRCEFHPLNNTCGLSYSYGEEGIGGHLLCNPPPSSTT